MEQPLPFSTKSLRKTVVLDNPVQQREKRCGFFIVHFELHAATRSRRSYRQTW
jgi:hypothetical protein